MCVGLVLVGDAMPATLLAAVLAQQLPRARIQHPHDVAVPLHFHTAADPAWRRAVVSGIDFDAAIQVYAPVAKLIQAEWLQRQWQQRRLLFGEHGCYLALGGAVDARVGPLSFPVIEIGLRLFQALKAQALQAVCSWRVRRRARLSPSDRDPQRDKAARWRRSG